VTCHRLFRPPTCRRGCGAATRLRQDYGGATSRPVQSGDESPQSKAPTPEKLGRAAAAPWTAVTCHRFFRPPNCRRGWGGTTRLPQGYGGATSRPVQSGDKSPQSKAPTPEKLARAAAAPWTAVTCHRLFRSPTCRRGWGGTTRLPQRYGGATSRPVQSGDESPQSKAPTRGEISPCRRGTVDCGDLSPPFPAADLSARLWRGDPPSPRLRRGDKSPRPKRRRIAAVQGPHPGRN
jgi:hypothetical protein